MATKYEELASSILRDVGGEGNVASVTHCATRLRLQLKDRDKADKTAVEKTKGVITVVEAGGQFQVVIGNNVGHVYEAVLANSKLEGADGGGVKKGFMGTAIDLITSIFTPFLWVLAGTGLLKALLAVVVKVDPSWAGTPSYAILFSAADAVFQFLPILIAVTAAKKFKANIYSAIAIAGALIYSATISVIPNADGVSTTLSGYAASGGQLTFFGIPVVMISYLSAVIPTIVAIFAQSRLERGLNRVIPEAVRNFLVPMLTIAIIVPLTFIVIGPVSDFVGSQLSAGVNWVWGLSPALGGAIMGGFWQVFVIFGLHWGFVPVMLQDLSSQGYSLLTGPLFAAVLAQAAATAAVFVKTRNKELKEVAGPATVSGFLAGITEPAIYGVTLRLKKPFIYGCIGGAIGGAIAAAGGSAAEGFVLPGAITLTSTMNIGNFTLQLIGTSVAMIIAFTLTLVLGFKDIPSDEVIDEATDKLANEQATLDLTDSGIVAQDASGRVATLVRTAVVEVGAPVAGKVVPLAEVKDPLFATEALGKGVGIQPESGSVVAPVSGQVVSAMPHAFGISADNGAEVLVHVGIDTVKLDGRHFSGKVAKGQRVVAGQVLTEVDFAGIAKEGYDTTTMVIVTNSSQFEAVVPGEAAEVGAGTKVLDLIS